MKKALIYGFGWSGYTLLQFLEDCGFEVFCVDEKVDFSKIALVDKRYISKETALKMDFDIYLITIFNKQKARLVYDNLVALGIDKNKIKHGYDEGYTRSMSYLIKRFFSADILKELLLDDYELSNFHNKLKELAKTHHQNKRDKSANAKTLKKIKEIESALDDRNVFAKIKALSSKNYDNNYMYYPGFSVSSSSFMEDKDFYFIEKIDWEFLQNRPKDKRLIAVFGNSALRVQYLPTSSTITSFMRESLDENYVVVNFGVVGASIYEQLLLYNALVYPLKPEIVISCFGGVEYVYAPISDKTLLKRHKISYTPWNWEKSFRDSIHSTLPLYSDILGEVSKDCVNLSYWDANDAINLRVRQFANNVSVGGGGILWFYPASATL